MRTSHPDDQLVQTIGLACLLQPLLRQLIEAARAQSLEMTRCKKLGRRKTKAGTVLLRYGSRHQHGASQPLPERQL
jgi:hypothetical protein